MTAMSIIGIVAASVFAYGFIAGVSYRVFSRYKSLDGYEWPSASVCVTFWPVAIPCAAAWEAARLGVRVAGWRSRVKANKIPRAVARDGRGRR